MRQDFPACADIIKKEFDMICEIAREKKCIIQEGETT